MKAAFFVLALVGTALGGLIERQTPDNDNCKADNCARAVTGTRNGFASEATHIADCESFNVVTTHYLAGVTIAPTATPTYASACSGGVRYASACSCWGFPVSTITLYADDGGADDAWHP